MIVEIVYCKHYLVLSKNVYEGINTRKSHNMTSLTLSVYVNVWEYEGQ